MGRNLRGLAQDRHVDVGDAAAQRLHAVQRILQEDTRARAAPGRVARGKVLADVAVADGAEDRIGQRVERHIRVRVALEALGVGNADPAQPDMIAGCEGVHVKAAAVARLEQGRRFRPAAARRA